MEQALRRACKGYVLDVKSDHHFGSWVGKPPVAGTARKIARDLELGAWQRPAGTGIQALVAVEGHRWAIEDSLETAKNELGLDHNETRSWHGWHRHVSLVMLAFAMMAVIRYHANDMPPQKRLRIRKLRT